MTTSKNHERRITDLESHVGKIDEVLASHTESLYTLRRGIIRNDIGMNQLLDNFGLPRVSEEQVDEVLDAE